MTDMTPAPAAAYEDRVERLTEGVPCPRYPSDMENGLADATNALAASELARGSKEWELQAVDDLWNKLEGVRPEPLATDEERLGSSLVVPVPIPGRFYTRSLQYVPQEEAEPGSSPTRVIVEWDGNSSEPEETLILTGTTVLRQVGRDIRDMGHAGITLARERLEAVDLAVENWPKACWVDGLPLESVG